jgi:hypothetical protein
MCLYTRQIRARRAEKDIICYKTVRRCYNSADCDSFTAKYKNFIYSLGKAYTTSLFCEIPPRWSLGYTIGLINFGFHSFADLNTAAKDRQSCEVILKCVIPKDTLYYESSDGSCYCSKSIKIVAWKKYMFDEWKEAKE